MSARARILTWMLLLVGAALAVCVVTTRSILLARVDHNADVQLAHEVAKLHEFTAAASTPGAATTYRSAADLLHAYLRTNVAEENESSFSIVDGRPDRRSAGDPPARLDTNPAFVSSLARSTEPHYGHIATSAGPARYAVVPVTVVGDRSTAELVVVEFTAADRAFADSVIGVLISVGVSALLLAGAIGWLVAGRVLAPVRLMRTTAEQVGGSDLSLRIDVEGNDDLAALARTVNRMLDRLEHAFATQRTFIDDAGHELRTPITIIRGHLELLGDDPRERRATIALVTDELDRMRRIVDDLLVLAQSERPDFLRLGPVDLTDLVVDALAKASALGERTWTLGPVPEGEITADGQRLTQAIMQLAANAVAHTTTGDRIEIGAERDQTGVRCWVSDRGAGIAEQDQDRIFRRFARSGAGRGPGAGLGLAIVRSIAEAHGGTVSVTSELGAGATFTLFLPAVPTVRTATIPSGTVDG